MRLILLDIGTKIRFKANVDNDEEPNCIFAKAGEFGSIVHIAEDGAPIAEVNDNGIYFAIKPAWVDICG